MKKNIIRLTESDLHKIIRESVNMIMENEDFHFDVVINKIMEQIDFDELIKDGETCITASMLHGIYFDIELKKTPDKKYTVQVMYEGLPYTDIAYLKGKTMKDLKEATRETLKTLPTDVLLKMADRNLWIGLD